MKEAPRLNRKEKRIIKERFTHHTQECVSLLNQFYFSDQCIDMLEFDPECDKALKGYRELARKGQRVDEHLSSLSPEERLFVHAKMAALLVGLLDEKKVEKIINKCKKKLT